MLQWFMTDHVACVGQLMRLGRHWCGMAASDGRSFCEIPAECTLTILSAILHSYELLRAYVIG